MPRRKSSSSRSARAAPDEDRGAAGGAAYLIVDSDLVVLETGPGFAALPGVPLEPEVGGTLEQALPVPGLAEAVGAAMEEGRSRSAELPLPAPDGRHRLLVTVVVPPRPRGSRARPRAVVLVQAVGAGSGRTQAFDPAALEQALRQSEAKSRALFAAIPDMILWLDPEGRLLDVEAGKDLHLPLPAQACRGKHLREVLPDICAETLRAVGRARRSREPKIFDFRLLQGRENRDYEARVVPGEAEAALVVVRDITERKRLEEQLRQSQKMEAVGTLAGGVAHDFNNMLTVMKGYAELQLRKLEPGDPLRRHPEQILRAAERALDLTRRLLVFSRKQVAELVELDLNQVVANLGEMLHRLIGEDITLVLRLDPALGRILADAGEMEQVIVNLAVNARDAMPSGGDLFIETTNVSLDQDFADTHVGVEPGVYVMLEVSDTGMGIAPEIQSHLFEPFFTTKDRGQGTGLGLSTVYAIVKKSDGHIFVESELGQGATFRIYLPRAQQSQRRAPEEAAPRGAPRGSETILLVEDEDNVRELVQEVLRAHGYRVLLAADGEEAIRIGKGEERIDLLLTDVVMPQVSGPQVAKQLTAQLPKLKVIYISGYSGDAIAKRGVVAAGTHLVQKPFNIEALARKVREVLDGGHPSSGAEEDT